MGLFYYEISYIFLNELCEACKCINSYTYTDTQFCTARLQDSSRRIQNTPKFLAAGASLRIPLGSCRAPQTP